jgi:hypothetical protein
VKSLVSTDLTDVWLNYNYCLTWGFATLTRSQSLATYNIKTWDLQHPDLQLVTSRLLPMSLFTLGQIHSCWHLYFPVSQVTGLNVASRNSLLSQVTSLHVTSRLSAVWFRKTLNLVCVMVKSVAPCAGPCVFQVPDH